MSFLILDLETIHDPALPNLAPPYRPDEPPRTPPPVHCQIVCATGLLLRRDYSVQAIKTFTDEREALLANIDVISRSTGRLTLVTYAGRFFDLPVLAARAFIHGIPFPRYYQPRDRDSADMRYRYDASAHLDLSDYLSDYGEARRARMDAYARAIGFAGKGDIDGSKVGDLVAAGRLDEVVTYNQEDVIQETAIFLRTQFLRGVLDAPGYRKAMGGLLEWMATQPRLAKLLTAIDRERAMAVWAPPAPEQGEQQEARTEKPA